MNPTPSPLSTFKESHPPVELSIVVPVYNERDNLAPISQEICSVMEKLGMVYEILFIDDGSQDGSFDVLKSLFLQNHHIRVVQFRRNFGQTAVFSAGFDQARGEYIVTIDADGQNDPADIPRLVEKIVEGDYDMVVGWRKNRKVSGLRRLLSRTANLIIRQGSKINVHDRGCSLKIFRSDLAKSMRLYGQLHRFLPEMAESVGARVAEMVVNDRPRRYGSSKYGALGRTPRVVLDMITVFYLVGFSNSPMRFFGTMGLVSGLVGMLIGGMLAFAKVYAGLTGGWQAFHAYQIGNRPMLLLSILLVLVGVQFLMMGLLGEMMMRIYYEAQGKAPYHIRQVLDNQPADLIELQHDHLGGS